MKITILDKNGKILKEASGQEEVNLVYRDTYQEGDHILLEITELKEHYDEIGQEALMALYNAAVSYSDGKNVTFGLYAKICIHNRIVSYVRKVMAQKRRAEKISSASVGNQKKSESPEELLEILERNGEFKRFLDGELSSYEKKVFSLYLQKKSYSEIAEELGKTEKSVDNALTRVKNKIKRKFY
jgi:RNA polymerase sporulation-specific sigma factor